MKDLSQREITLNCRLFPSELMKSLCFWSLQLCGLKVDLLEFHFSGQMTAAQRGFPPLRWSPLFCVPAFSNSPSDRNVILTECGRSGRGHHLSAELELL